MKGQQVVTCPNCGDNKVKFVPVARDWFIITGLLTIFIIGIPFALYTLYKGIKASRDVRKSFRCESCKHWFKVSPDAYKEYQKHLA